LPYSLPDAAPLLRLAVPNELAAVESTRLQVHDAIAGLGLSARLIYRLELVLEETLMNRLWHAFPDGGRHSTDLSLHLVPEALVLCFDDDGIAFDPLQAPPTASPRTLSEAAPGGLGLMLTRKAASTCTYERVAGRNRFTVHLARD